MVGLRHHRQGIADLSQGPPLRGRPIRRFWLFTLTTERPGSRRHRRDGRYAAEWHRQRRYGPRRYGPRRNGHRQQRPARRHGRRHGRPRRRHGRPRRRWRYGRRREQRAPHVSQEAPGRRQVAARGVEFAGRGPADRQQR
ncbi:hypothetical protein ADK35_25325 [Streptomyces viridochromogenes]|nr:hypothetical protein ADK35_25325 [Streptomyces viridochromogenes]KOG20190.1 hypothetical protein ADK36_17985 [Streptomyces viridochromogenes]